MLLQLIHIKIYLNIPIFKFKIVPKITLKKYFRSKSKSVANNKLLTSEPSIGSELNRLGLNQLDHKPGQPESLTLIILFF